MATRGGRRGGRGGNDTTPRRPAAVSGPGALSRRTDGGPGAQPVRPVPAEQHGDRQASVELQQAAPLAAAAPPGAGAPPGAAAPTSPGPIELPDVFAPTARPGEPITTGNLSDSPMPIRDRVDSTLALLQVLYEANPHEDIARLIDKLMNRGRPGRR